jgi:hypothetical protein
MRVGHLSHKEFSYILTMNEFLASNETEILTYFRIPSMREHSLNYKTLYDLLREAGIDEKPSVSELLTLRLAILHGEKHPTISKIESLPGADEVLQFIRKFKNSNKLWCDLWYEHFPKSEFAHALFRYEDEPMTVPAIDYERFLMDYNPNGVYNNQDQYEQNVVRNVRTLVILTRSQYAPPRTLGECEQILTKMSAQNIVMMPEAAKAFHQKYLANKPIGVGAKK